MNDILENPLISVTTDSSHSCSLDDLYFVQTIDKAGVVPPTSYQEPVGPIDISGRLVTIEGRVDLLAWRGIGASLPQKPMVGK